MTEVFFDDRLLRGRVQTQLAMRNSLWPFLPTQSKKRPAMASALEAETQGLPPSLIFSHPLPPLFLIKALFFGNDATAFFKGVIISRQKIGALHARAVENNGLL